MTATAERCGRRPRRRRPLRRAAGPCTRPCPRPGLHSCLVGAAIPCRRRVALHRAQRPRQRIDRHRVRRRRPDLEHSGRPGHRRPRRRPLNAATERLTPRRFTPVKPAKGWLAEDRVVLEHLLHRLSPASARDLSDLDSGRVASSRSTGTSARPTARPRGNSTWSRQHAPTSNAKAVERAGHQLGLSLPWQRLPARRQRDRGPLPCGRWSRSTRPRAEPGPSRSRACVKPGDGSADLRSVG